jgi:hypothetical protein
MDFPNLHPESTVSRRFLLQSHTKEELRTINTASNGLKSQVTNKGNSAFLNQQQSHDSQA